MGETFGNCQKMTLWPSLLSLIPLWQVALGLTGLDGNAVVSVFLSLICSSSSSSSVFFPQPPFLSPYSQCLSLSLFKCVINRETQTSQTGENLVLEEQMVMGYPELSITC